METAAYIIPGIAVLRTLRQLDQRIRYAEFCKILGWGSVRGVGALLDKISLVSPSARRDRGRVIGHNGKPSAGFNHSVRLTRELSPGRKAARTRKLRAAGQKAAATRKRNAA